MIHVVGHNGQLGRSLLSTDNAIKASVLNKGDIVINCAAKTHHLICNTNPDQAWESNVELVKELVKKCKASNAFLIHISTDYVFNREWPTNIDESKETMPIQNNTYAVTKQIAEEYLKICKFENWICVRTSWLLSPYKVCEWLGFPTVWDQYGSPVWAPNFAESLIDLCKNIHLIPKRNFYHYTNNSITSRLELASHYREKPVLTVKCPDDRPYCSALRNTKINWNPRPISSLEVINQYKAAQLNESYELLQQIR